MKARIVLVGALMFFGISAAAFAQANFDTGSTPVTAVTRSGFTERTGDITFTQTSGTSVAGTITVSYGVPITIDIVDAMVVGLGCYAGGEPVGVYVNEAASSNSGGTLVLAVPAGCPAVAGNTIRVTGVRVAISGTALTVLDASLSSTGNTITTGQLNPRVISAIAAGIASLTITPTGGGSVNAVTGVPVGNSVTTSDGVAGTGGSIRVLEGFLNAFGAFPVVPETNSTLIRFTLSAAPPPGVTIIFEGNSNLQTSTGGSSTGAGTLGVGAYSTADCATGAISGGNVTFTSTSTTLQLCYGITSAAHNPDPAVQERVSVDFRITSPGSTSLPLSTGTVTLTATFAPISTLYGDGTSTNPGIPIPRYSAEEVGPVSVVTVFGANTTLLIPFATTVTGANYNTGIAISNSTSDPGLTAMGLATAIKQTGTMTFYFYPGLPSTAAPFTYTTAAGSPGSGLNAAGALPTGSTYTVLLSQLLAAAGQPADFSGYIFVICNFTNAHSLYVVSNFTSFSQGSHALVIALPRSTTPEALAQ
jgi:hypothetical protein